MKKIILIAILFPLISHAEQDVVFECQPIEGQVSFRVKGNFNETGQGERIGHAHSYLAFGNPESIEGCRVPWFEKFPLNGSTSVKFLLHGHEYMPGCIQRLQIPQNSGVGFMWVELKENSLIKSKAVKAHCEVTRNAQ
ncbi:hypothetical protein KUV95_16595 [Microbulbifer agarilyticus]|uniref:hypothetical protein n=1 Tax=Microbulbifer agarilyticus TaxID=260552 RepID=UPI001C959089|nr:hypothetical protein [Microbulbifer agarilyticus]MBY6189330.1 hypothetical protein [Microbulbifer agarilyticus]MBY6213172.1 hypothetical protein [Microbulbifer agarilyticus]